MRVAMVVSEMEPFAKTGGLADVAGALPLALGKLGVQVHVFLPRYGSIRQTGPKEKIGRGITVHFIDHEHYFRRPKLYGESNGDYPDNLERFSFFCRRALERMKSEGIRPDLLHAHDWQAALGVVYLRSLAGSDPFFSSTRSVFTVHNLAYQGLFPKEEYPRTGLPWELFQMEGLEFWGKVNLLKGGLLFADMLTTVSPTYSKEIQTPDQGEGLDGVLRKRSRDLVGILNGIDQAIWDPAADPHLPVRFDHRSMRAKAQVKAALQKEVGLPVNPGAFLIGMVTRLASQKGLDLVVSALPRMLKLPVQLVILGSGDRPIEEQLERASKESPSIRVRLAFDNPLAHRIYAGADAFLMPSRYEPCGLGQMIALRYGTIPVVRATGGLNDTIRDLEQDSQRGNGFSFRPYEPEPLVGAIRRALAWHRDKARWHQVQVRGMKTDFSWDQSAREYVRLYENLKGSDPLKGV